jgi:hypothetical protein
MDAGNAASHWKNGAEVTNGGADRARVVRAWRRWW